MELKQLQVFLAAAKTLNFSRAAETLNYAQSTVTTHIQSLESELDVRLFERLGKRVMLTEAGHRLQRYAEQILQLSDVAFLLEPAADSDALHIEPLCPEPVVLVCHPRHPLTQRKAVCPADLTDETLLLTEPGCHYRSAFESAIASAETVPANRLELGSIKAIKRCAMEGLGLGVLPEVAVRDEIATGRMKALAWTGCDFNIVTQIAWHKDKWLSPAMKAFIDVVREACPCGLSDPHGDWSRSARPSRRTIVCRRMAVGALPSVFLISMHGLFSWPCVSVRWIVDHNPHCVARLDNAGTLDDTDDAPEPQRMAHEPGRQSWLIWILGLYDASRLCAWQVFPFAHEPGSTWEQNATPYGQSRQIWKTAECDVGPEPFRTHARNPQSLGDSPAFLHGYHRNLPAVENLCAARIHRLPNTGPFGQTKVQVPWNPTVLQLNPIHRPGNECPLLIRYVNRFNTTRIGLPHPYHLCADKQWQP